MSLAVLAWVTNLELDEQLERRPHPAALVATIAAAIAAAAAMRMRVCFLVRVERVCVMDLRSAFGPGLPAERASFRRARA